MNAKSLKPAPFHQRATRGFALLAAALLLAACGGGGDGSTPTPQPPAPPPPPPPSPTKAELETASKFAAYATFGLNYAGIEQLAESGTDAWLDAQFSLPVEHHKATVDELLERRQNGDFDGFEADGQIIFLIRRLAWWHQTITGQDVLRQRVAFALSEIFVVSDNVDALILDPYALSGYYDMLLDNAFGNFRELLRSVTLHPAMGIYLSHVNNQKTDHARNTFPDENYAREVMQLFSIGLFELNPDGSPRLDSNGLPIATYSNSDIREFAKIFTGFSYSGGSPFFGNPIPNFEGPMQMFDAFHEQGEKRLLNGALVPAGQSGMSDVDDAIDNLFSHPNVGPFIGRQLIQRLVTSNPSPAYVERVAQAFDDNGNGVRGDMRSVLRAVLTDTAATMSANDFGKLREPVVRYAALLRQLNASSDDGFIAIYGYWLQEFSGQHPLSSPSVFNFFQPAHSPAGELAAHGLVAPEFQITTSTTIVGISNLADLAVTLDLTTDTGPPFEPVVLDMSNYLELADDADALLDRLDLVLTYGSLSGTTRSAMSDILNEINDPEVRVRTAIYMFLISPDYAVRG